MPETSSKKCPPERALAIPAWHFALCIVLLAGSAAGLVWLGFFGLNIWCFVLFPLLMVGCGFYLEGSRQEIRNHLLAELAGANQGYQPVPGERFMETDLIRAGFFPDGIGFDGCQPQMVFRRGNLAFSQTDLGRMASGSRGSPSFRLLDHFLFFKLEIDDSASNGMLLAAPWKHQFGIWNGIKSMGFWHAAPPRLTTPAASFPGFCGYGQSFAPKTAAALTSLLEALSPYAGRCNLAIRGRELYLAIRAKLPVSLVSETKNRRTLADYQERIQALTATLERLERHLSGARPC